MGLDFNKFLEKFIALAGCDDFLSIGLCFNDEGEAACFSSSWFVILKHLDIERRKCVAVVLKGMLSSGTRAGYDRLLESYEPDYRPLYQR